MTKGYQKENTSVHLMNYHFVWSPKYRRKLLTGEVKVRLKKLIEDEVNKLGCAILRLEIMPDHVHLFVSSNPKLSPNRIIGNIKGASSRVLRKEFPRLLRMPTLWTRSYFVSTAGNVSSGVIQRYIDQQFSK